MIPLSLLDSPKKHKRPRVYSTCSHRAITWASPRRGEHNPTFRLSPATLAHYYKTTIVRDAPSSHRAHNKYSIPIDEPSIGEQRREKKKEAIPLQFAGGNLDSRDQASPRVTARQVYSIYTSVEPREKRARCAERISPTVCTRAVVFPRESRPGFSLVA